MNTRTPTIDALLEAADGYDPRRPTPAEKALLTADLLRDTPLIGTYASGATFNGGSLVDSFEYNMLNDAILGSRQLDYGAPDEAAKELGFEFSSQRFGRGAGDSAEKERALYLLLREIGTFQRPD